MNYPKPIKVDLDGSGLISFRSKGELQCATDLHRRGVPFDYEQEHFTYEVTHKYTPDFRIITKTDKRIWIEYKGSTPGWRSGADRKKIQRVLDKYPLLDLRIVWHSERFASAKIRAGGKTTNREWAQKMSIRQAVKVVPESWLDE